MSSGSLHNIRILALVLACCVLASLPVFLRAAPMPASRTTLLYLPLTTTEPLYGVLQPRQEYQANAQQAGLKIRTLEIGWNLYEPRESDWSVTYIGEQRTLLARLREAGFLVVLDLGLQNPPDWIWGYSNSQFINQYGTRFQGGLGVNGLNAIFNQAIRDRQARYIQRVFADLGTSFYAVRLGGGPNNELMYPPPTYKTNLNSYWAYDDIAQGRTPGLPPGMRPAPLRDWIPGSPSALHSEAAEFVNWYIESLKNFQDWQIASVRAVYPGKLMVLYPSWGIRPGELAAAITSDLSGITSPELNGEIQRGLDIARFVAGITDRNVILYTTWLDAPDDHDLTSNIDEWTPAHYLAWLASTHSPSLTVWGENARPGSEALMERCISQVRRHRLGGMLWAFEPDLYSGNYASIQQYARFIAGAR